MLRLMLAFALALIAVDASAATGTAPITSPEALARYLRDTPLAQSPLGQLSPGGRKRFLARLQFGRSGLDEFSLDDLASELTPAQATAVMALFGEQAHAEGIGLAPDEYVRRHEERVAEATRRGCALDTCPETLIEQRYDTLVLHRHPGPDASRRATIASDYARLFADAFPSPRLARTSAPDLRLLARAAKVALDADPDGHAADDLSRVLQAMQSRGMAEDADFLPLYRARLTTRRFAAAQALAQAHPGLHVAPLPSLRDDTNDHRSPTVLTLAADGRQMTRESVDLDVPLRIVVVAACHFSEDAARAIAADPRLGPLFRQHALWLASDTTPLGDAAAWNAALPSQPIHLAWHDRDWSMLDSWAMPTYYVFHHGREVARWHGWRGLEALRTELAKAGVPY